MSLIKSISGIRGTIGGAAGDGLTPLDIVKFTSAYATFIRRTTQVKTNKIVVGRDARLSGGMVRDVVCGTLMGMVNTILNAITYVLVAFTAISLVVSTVMIGVITYVSVVERTKEIGILRSIGARKRDIRHVFNAETFIIGLCAGLIGIGVAYLLQGLINLILTPLTGIAGLAALPIWQALIMVCISVALTLISGLIPASAAAKKDPVIALRSE